jgi:hypothetical protein
MRNDRVARPPNSADTYQDPLRAHEFLISPGVGLQRLRVDAIAMGRSVLDHERNGPEVIRAGAVRGWVAKAKVELQHPRYCRTTDIS